MEKILLHLIVYINKKISIKEGIVYSVMNLSLVKIKKTEDFVSKKIQQKVELKNLIDKSLISGIKVVVDNHIIEDNVLSRLEQMRIKLLGKG